MSTPNPFSPAGPLAPQGPYQVNGQPSSSPGSPGIGGALKDALAAIFMSIAPKSITQRKSALKAQEAQAVGSAAPTGLGSEF